MSDWKSALAGLKASGVIPETSENSQADSHAQASSESERTPKSGPFPGQEGALNVVFERKGRGGKSATIIEGFTVSDEKVGEIAARLRKSIGTGGSHRGGEILLQGECRRKAAEILRSLGFKVKGI